MGFLVAAPILILLLVPDFIAESDSERAAGVGADRFGSATKSKVCGDRLCTETGGRIIFNATSEESKVTHQEEVTCLRQGEPIPCEALESILIQEETISELETTINELETKVEDLKAVIEENMTQYSSILKLSRANVPATIPLHQGYYNGEPVYYIITDSSDLAHAEIISNIHGWQVEHSPLLANASESILSKTYVFTNGVPGDGVHGFQGEVFTSTPEQTDVYSALTSHVHVTWKPGAISRILDSEREINNAHDQNQITFTELDVVINMPQIVWPSGQMPVKADKTLTDDVPFVGGQVLDIDLKEKTVTFIAHRGWGPDGKTTYCIITDATPVGPANMLGVTNVPTNQNLITKNVTANVFHFLNGIKGVGPMGFQTGISSSAPGDANYSPMWRVFMIDWNEPESAVVLVDKNDIDFFEQEGKININVAKPMNEDHVINCPVIDPFQ